MDNLGFERAVDCLVQGIVIAVADAAHRWFDASFRQPLAVANILKMLGVLAGTFSVHQFLFAKSTARGGVEVRQYLRTIA